MKLQLMKRRDTDGRGFESSPRLESRHGGFTSDIVSPHHYPASQGYLYPLLAYTEIPPVEINPVLKKRKKKRNRYQGKPTQEIAQITLWRFA